MASPEQPPLPLLFLIGDTGGGHRSAAAAVQQSLERVQPGRFAPVICDPLRGPDVPGLLRWFAGLYGLCIRLTPWLWWSFWRTSNSPFGLRLLRRTIMAPVYGSVERAVEASRPALIVAFHPMTADPAVRARRITGTAAPAITVVTDLVTAHLSWVDAAVDRVVVPSEVVADQCARDGTPAGRYVPLGLPVAAEFCRPPLDEAQRRELKRQLGLRGEFLVVLTGGAEGSGRLRRCAAAILRQVADVDVVVICGRNRSLRRRVGRLAERTAGGRLTAQGFVGNMADWLRCADIVVGKAGPGTIAEATCCGAPLVLTSFVPGQEKGNAEFVDRLRGRGVRAAAAAARGRGRPSPPRPGRARRHARRVGSGRPPRRGGRHRPLHRRAGGPGRGGLGGVTAPARPLPGWPGRAGRTRRRGRRLAQRAAPGPDGGDRRDPGAGLAATAAALRRPHPGRAQGPVGDTAFHP